MSGGHFDYNEENLAESLFNTYIPRYRDNRWKEEYNHAKQTAIAVDPFEDIRLDALVFDILYLIHQRDFYLAGDTGEDTWKKERDWFYNLYFNDNSDEQNENMKQLINDRIDSIRDELIKQVTK